MLDIYLQLSLPSWVGNFNEWLWLYSLQKVYGQPNDPRMKPRMIYVGHVRLLGVMLGISLTHNCKQMEMPRGPAQQL